MKRISLLLAAAIVAVTFAFSASAQEDTMKKIGSEVKHDSVKVWKKGRRVGTTVGHKTWNGTKWVASKSYRGGRWVAIKTKHGVKWVYRKAKHPKRSTRQAL